MAVNPMQRKANNSFLLGILVTLIVTGVIIAFLLMQLSTLSKEKAKNESTKISAYVITGAIKSGTEITIDKVQAVDMNLGSKSDVVYSGTAPLPSGLKAKVDLSMGAVLTKDLVYEDTLVAKDVRNQEYNVIHLPSQLESGEYIDVRLRLPNGQDYIVVSHKEVTIPQINGINSKNCVWIKLKEEETLNMSSAIVEAYTMNGAKLYATRYVEPGIQDAATPTYLPSSGVIALMDKNPNIVQDAKNAIFTRYNKEATTIRNPIDSAKRNEDAQENLKKGVENEILGLQEERTKYLESLGM